MCAECHRRWCFAPRYADGWWYSAQMPDETVELFTAYYWNCPNCGQENFEHGVQPELTDDEWLELQKQIDPDAGESWREQSSEELATFRQEMGLIAQPISVKCGKCAASYPVEHEPVDPEDLPERFRPKA